MPRRTHKLSRCAACRQPRRLNQRSGRCRACAHRAYAERGTEPESPRVYDELARELVRRGLVSTAVLGLTGPRPRGEGTGVDSSCRDAPTDNPAASCAYPSRPKPPLQETP